MFFPGTPGKPQANNKDCLHCLSRSVVRHVTQCQATAPCSRLPTPASIIQCPTITITTTTTTVPGPSQGDTYILTRSLSLSNVQTLPLNIVSRDCIPHAILPTSSPTAAVPRLARIPTTFLQTDINTPTLPPVFPMWQYGLSCRRPCLYRRPSKASRPSR